MQKPDCVFTGLNTIDLLGFTNGFIHQDTKTKAKNIIVDGGGPAATAACAAAVLGLKTALFTALGNDSLTPFALESLKKYGVNTRFIKIVNNLQNPVSLIIVNQKNASRTVVWNNQGLEQVKLAIPKEIFNTRAMCFDGHLMAISIKLAAKAKQKGIVTVLDLGSVKPSWHSLAQNCSYIIASHLFARQIGLTAKEAVVYLANNFDAQCAVTTGKKGFIYFDTQKGKPVSVAQRKFKAADTTGCGDIFHGAFVAALLQQKTADFKQALLYAQECAGLATLKQGGRRSITKPL